MTDSMNEPATRGDLQELAQELRADASAQRQELRADMHAELSAQKMEVLERMEKMETTLLTEFHKWARIAESKFRVHDVQLFSLTERITSLEERLTVLEHRN